LPSNWNAYPAPAVLADMAEQWIMEAKTIALRVPGCIVHSANNYILNCRHSDFNKIKIIDISKFELDVRLRK
jgi:RES domain-containing protein